MTSLARFPPLRCILSLGTGVVVGNPRKIGIKTSLGLGSGRTFLDIFWEGGCVVVGQISHRSVMCEMNKFKCGDNCESVLF